MSDVDNENKVKHTAMFMLKRSDAILFSKVKHLKKQNSLKEMPLFTDIFHTTLANVTYKTNINVSYFYTSCFRSLQFQNKKYDWL